MAHLGVLSYHGTGHLNPLIALGKKLQSRGHSVTFFLPPQCEALIRNNGLGFWPIALGPAAAHVAASQRSESWLGDLRTRLHRIDVEIGAYLKAYPAAIQSAGVDALIMGEITIAGPTVAELLGMPYCVISTSIPHNFGWDAPHTLLADSSWQARLQSKILEVSIFRMTGPVERILNRYRHALGLGPAQCMEESHPELAHVTQWPRCLDISRRHLPKRFHYSGPFVDESGRLPVPFPWEKLSEQPFVYASLGTTRKADPDLYTRIAAACAELRLQLVITLGGGRDSQSFAHLPGNTLVVQNAPQLDLIRHADLVITHAGPNTVLETLRQGKPMLALPIALDQPAIAHHLKRLGVAVVAPPAERSVGHLCLALLKLKQNYRYAESAKALQGELQKIDGAQQAALIIEQALQANSLRKQEGMTLA